jgi:hypothetical protein
MLQKVNLHHLGGGVTTEFDFHILYFWDKLRLHTEFQLHRLPGSTLKELLLY